MISIKARFQVDNDCNGITINISKKITTYIRAHTNNQSEWVKEAGKDFLQILKDFIFPNLSEESEGRKIITITKPSSEDLETIYDLITDSQIVCSRSEFYRVAVLFRIIMDTIEKYKFEDIRKQQKKRQRKEKKKDKKGFVRVPMKKDENGETIFKIYKLLKKTKW